MTNEVNFYFLNVNNGDSIIIEIISETTEYIVIDCNRTILNNTSTNPAYEFLKAKNVERINTLLISHFHQDHYNGIEMLLNDFEIEKVVIPPFLSQKSDQYKKIIAKFKESIKNIIDRTGEDEVIDPMKSILSLLVFIIKNDDKILEAGGPECLLRFPNVDDIKGYIYLPLKKIKGMLHRMIDDPDFQFNNYPEMNDSSIALMISCFGYNVLLTGDSTYRQWFDHQIFMRRDNISNLNIDCLKSPHHGSKHNNKDKLYKYFYRPDSNEKHIVVSADGVKHPHSEFFDLINNFNLIPYCTNRSHYCLPKNLFLFEPKPDVPLEAEKMLKNYLVRPPIACQGNICLSINIGGAKFSNSTGVPCAYHGI